MQINYATARSLCTAAEFSLISDSKPKTLTGFSIPELKRKIIQARRYSDKWREQALRQGNSSDGSASRSRQKEELFGEVVARFEAKLARVTAVGKASAAKAAKKTAAKKTVKSTAKKTVKKAVKKPAPKRVTARTKQAVGPPDTLAKQVKRQAIGINQRLAASGLTTRIRGHISASGRRNQAARSSRKRS